MSLIEVENLTKIYQVQKKEPGFLGTLKGVFARETVNKKAVADVSFVVEKGEIVGFLGPNGAGKTTTLKILSGILLPTSGQVKVLGYTPWKREPDFQRQFALVMGQKNQLVWDLPAGDSLKLQAAVYGVPEREYKQRLIKMAEVLEVDRLMSVQIRRLSLGERMKMELIAALIHKPKVIFLDEPTIGLDLLSQQKVREFIKEWNREEETTILLTSHYLEDVKSLCERVIIISQGKKLFDGSLESLSRLSGDKKVLKVTFNKPVLKSELEKIGKVTKFAESYAEVEINRQDVTEKLTLLLKRFDAADIDVADVGIEEVIGDIYKKELAA